MSSEYLTCEDLSLKPSIVEQAKFEHSTLDTTFNKGLNENDEKERFFKRLKNIESKNEEQLKVLKANQKNN